MLIFFKKTIVWVVIIFLMSSIFRLSNLDLIEFKSDEATTLFQTFQFFNHPYLIERGLISGTGVYNFPLFNYLMIAIASFSLDPQILSGIIALINSFLVSAFFLLVRRYYNLMTALIAAILLAFSPWGVIFSRKIWAQDLINLFLVPILWLLHEIILKKNTKLFLPLFLLLTLLIQLHGSGLFFTIVTIIVFLILRIRVKFKSAMAGILLGLIPAIPYILFQINSSPLCPDCEAFSKYQQAIRTFDIYNLFRPFQIIGGLGFHFILGRNYADFVDAFPLVNLLKNVFILSFLGIVAGIFFIFRKNQKYLFLVIYFVTIPLLYLISRTIAYMHYFVIIIPMSILLFALSINTVFSLARNYLLKTAVIALFLLFLISNITYLIFFYRFLSIQKHIEGDYGPIYSLTKDFIEKETRDYKNLSYYPEIKSYAYIHGGSKDFHSKLGEFFLYKGEFDLAEKESKK